LKAGNIGVTLDRFVAACREDTRVVAAFLGGSHAAGRADEYSDLDLYVIVDDQNYDTFFAGRRAFLGHLGEPVFFEDFSDFGFDMVGFISYPADLEAVVIDKLERWDSLHLDH
jgi:predicted nucleotidyltransferase